MPLPNLFTHARSELAQDAVLAYMLEWAKPQHREQHPEMNALGEALLRAMLRASASANRNPTLGDNDPITELTVETQADRIDILVQVNRTFALVIEDKIDTHEHSNQIERYKGILAKSPTPTGINWVIHTIYVKTGNESPHLRPTAGTCGIMMRPDLLAILNRFSDIQNQIVQEFREHLQIIQSDTESYRVLPLSKWKTRVRAIQGFYGAIANWASDLFSKSELEINPEPQWSYQSNPAGREWVCAWYWTNLVRTTAQLWLQLSDVDSLQIRMANHSGPLGKPKVTSSQMYEMLQRLTETAANAKWKDHLFIRKAGRFGGGDSAAVAEMTFDAKAENWLPLDVDGKILWDETCRRLRLAMSFLDSIRS